MRSVHGTKGTIILSGIPKKFTFAWMAFGDCGFGFFDAEDNLRKKKVFLKS
jgi:hypothetical protein